MTIRTVVEFDDIEFQKSHGRAPRGRGYWAFSTDRRGREHLLFSPDMTYAEAKKWAKTAHLELAVGLDLAFLTLYVQP